MALTENMEADWNETARIALPAPPPSSPPTLVSTVAFDTSQELLWVGNTHGRLTSFYGADLQRYTSYRGHAEKQRGTSASAVKQILFCDRGLISVSQKSVHMSSRKGQTLWHIAIEGMHDLRCMSFVGKGNEEIIVAGCQREMFRIDVDKGSVLDTIAPSTLVPYTMMRRAKDYICASAHNGSIYILDQKTLQILNTWKAYAAQVNDMDVRGDYLLTTGWAPRHYQGPALEQLVRVYDLKNQRPAPPMSFPPGAAFVRMHPKLSSTCIVASQTGAIYSIDVQNPEIPHMRFAHTYEAQYTHFDFMPSGKGFAFTDSHNHIILWGSPTKIQFTEYSQPTEFADHASLSQLRQLDWSPDLPLSLIGMPYYREALLSVWPNSLVHEVGAPIPRIDPSLLAATTAFEHGRVGPWPRKLKRNEAEDTRALQKVHDPLGAPKFLSEKPRRESNEAEPERRMSEDITKTLNLFSNGSHNSDIPVWYNNVEIKYSKFGIDDFDFRYYNKTNYSGLETHIVNSYANPLLQLLRFTPVARNLALHHTALDCQIDHCLLCELGFLVDMLEKAGGQNCQATNFLKSLSKQPTAAALGILEENTINTPLTVMIQSLNRFLLNEIDGSRTSSLTSKGKLQPVFGTRGVALSRCSHCHYEVSQEKSWHTHDLAYPAKQPKHMHPRGAKHTFSQILKASIERDETQRGWCMRCQGYKAIKSRRLVANLPTALTLNTCIFSPESKQLWAGRGFLPKEIGLIVNNGQIFCYEGQDLQFHLQRRTFPVTVYELVGVVADVTSGESQKSHLVSTISVGISDADASHNNDWHLFNDFLVRQITADDALYFDPRWKLPSIITYQIKTMSHTVDNSWKDHIDTSILHRSVAQPGLEEPELFRSLEQAEPLPGVDSHCAIDAEFVRLLREEIDMRADGSRTITRPSRLGLARVSVLRGEGPDEGVPFIDDYISVRETVDDYLTRFSGLRPGDLTEGTSKFTLVNLKTVYKKLWVLLNLGVTFIGHGLSSDFRTINIFVPEAQVIDTQELFSLGSRGRRKLSLRFLAWLLLKEDIQQNIDDGHDSIEDARTALKLWRKFLEYTDAGILETKIDELWYKGKATDFKVPSDMNGRRIPETPTNSAPGTPRRQPASVVRTSTPGRSEFGSPLR
ncbi:hypothetical protein K431DRAFT_333256 [Polychaeton citri CBS 116435]|uniref:PAN2-PAN3 deadenylation complex catalytic subunit PAN2 n=1 Tax=Polychaeton citri CBS 116435 TaxID=1314669 RepID=A0A9P4UM53_9PEZI|nr:hypothetical protein K431DRAFT_333256 [Polychaeton citri CBS 116435]